MIITRTPLRISLVGGGTDLPAFFKRSPGAVVSFAIDKYIYVSINKKFDAKTRVSYSKTENVHHPMELKHDIIRESLLSYGVSGVEITTTADIPGHGTGLGSSSSLAVGLTRALYKYTRGRGVTNPAGFADMAYHIERNLCQHPVGKQDHYAASYGGLHYFQFNQDESVTAELFPFTDQELHEFASHFVLLWTGHNRNANDILKKQESNLGTERFSLAESMRDMAISLRDDLRSVDVGRVAEYLHANWEIKKQMAQGISNEWLDDKYRKAIQAGAHGGKLCGAGGGGFLLFWGPLGIWKDLENATGLKYIPFRIDTQGSQVIYED